MHLPLIILAAAFAQPATTGPATPPPPGPTAAQDQSPPALLAQRIAAVRAQTTVAPMLVLVDNEHAFNAALANWRTDKGRVLYPILFDTKTLESRKDIARFVRAFKPARIVRFTGTSTTTPPAANPTRADTARAVYASFGASDEAGYSAALAQRPGVPGPIGAVVTHDGDGRTAAAALAAAYGQAMVFADAPAQPGKPATFATADKLSADITSKLQALNLTYASLGDQIDALTLCYDTAAHVTMGNNDSPPSPIPQFAIRAGESFALTDIIGRDTSKERRSRWAFASHIPGNTADSTYRAMCAIFLQPTSASAFNGYERSGEFGRYDPTDGLKSLKAAGLTTGFIDRPNQSADEWRQWTSGAFATPDRYPMTMGKQPTGGALTSDLFLVNTMGNRDFFQLQPGYCYAGDVPFLSLPAAVNFTHSFSLQFSNDATTIGGRWLDRGAYCYVGSVHEPLLSAFVPQSQFVQRLTSGWPIAAAARVQASDRPINPFAQPWRIAVIGDALWTLGPALKRTTDLPLPQGATDLDAERAPALKERRWADAFDTFTMLGRDADAARLARAALNDEPEKIDRNAALRIVHIAYRAGDAPTLIKAAAKLDQAAGDTFDAAVADAVWHALWPRLSTMKADEAQLLAKNVRVYSYGWDSNMAATALKRAVSTQVARDFFDKQYAKCPDPESRKRMEEQRNTIFK